MRAKSALTRGALAPADVAGEPEAGGSFTFPVGTCFGGMGGLDQDMCSATTTS